MKHINTSKALLAGAAVAGILTGVVVTTTSATTTTKPSQLSFVAGTLADEKGETHECKGHNSCKGKGGCKAGDSGCAGKNTCKGKGGCGMKDGKPTGPK